MQVNLAHTLNDAEARETVDRAFAHYSSKYGAYNPRMRWLDADRAEIGFSAKGLSISGTIALVPGAIHIDAKVPLLLRPFTKRAIGALETEMQRWIADAQARRAGAGDAARS